jgi:two-component system cell cycle sensor histidine kinase/response regulator CckA
LENQLRHAQKMEAIGQMAGAITHDFNNILTTILGFTSLLLSEMETGDARRTYATEIREAGERATALVRQLLTFSRKQELNPRITDLETVVKGIERMLRRLIGDHVILAISFDPNTPRVKVDPGQMEQVIINLAMNAADSMPHTGTLTIDIGPEELDERYCARHPESRPGRYTVLSIADTGAGIPPEILGRIFEPFFTTKDAGKGTGLGLAIISGIVKKSKGFIQVESKVGSGTNFRIFLPALNTLSETTGPGDTAEPAPAGDETILVVEEEAGVRRTVRQALINHGYKVLEAANGRVALAESENDGLPIDLLLTDLKLPDLSGEKLGELLRRRNPGLKIIFMSGGGENTSGKNKAGIAGVSYMNKPFSALDLLETVRFTLDTIL